MWGGWGDSCTGVSSHLHGLLEQEGPGLHPVLDALQLCLILNKTLSFFAPVKKTDL